MNANLSISIIIPMHNEERNAPFIINKAVSMLGQLTPDWEIIVIESGSTDRTKEAIEVLAKDDHRIRVFHQQNREGMGSALRLGYSKCTKELVCHLEADSPFEMEYFKKALPILIENDCVIGYRIGKKENNFSWSYQSKTWLQLLMRMLFHVGYNALLRVVFGLVVRDVNFSFKIFRRKSIQDLQLISDGWFIDAEILLELRRKGILPIEMPIEYKDRNAGESTVHMATPVHIMREMSRYIRRHTRK